MDRAAFIRVCSEMGLLATELKRPQSAQRFQALAAQAKRKFWWKRTAAALDFHEAMMAMFQENAAG
jgi:hypothetical protein